MITIKRNTGVTIDEDLLRLLDERRVIAPGSAVRAPRSAVINDLLRKALEIDSSNKRSTGLVECGNKVEAH